MKFFPTLLLLFIFSWQSYSQPTAPVLRIETGMHTAIGRRMATDATGKYLLTCSDDKTARLWDISSGTLLNTFRVPVGGTNEGKLFSCGLSPDGKFAAMGGWTGYEWEQSNCIYIINVQSGSIVHRIKDLPEVTNDIEFSADGRWMAAGLGGGYGLRIFDTQGWGVYKTLDNYASAIYNVAFKPGGGLATACFDGKLRVYNSRFELVAEKNTIGGKLIYSLAFNPAGNLLAVGYNDAAAVQVFDAGNLALLYEPSVRDAENVIAGLNIVCFSADGNQLYGGGGFAKVNDDGIWKYVVRNWSKAGKGTYTDMLVMENSVMDLKAQPDGSMTVLGSFPDIAVIKPGNQVDLYVAPSNNAYNAISKSHFKVNNNGSSLGFTPLRQGAYSLDVILRKLQTEESFYPSPVEANAGTTVADWESSRNPTINGKKVEFLEGTELCRSADINSKGKQVVLGADWHIYLADANAQQIWKTPVPGEASAVNISSNDRVVIAALKDGSIRWYRMSDGGEILAFYLHADKKRWVFFTPSGYYDASPGAEDLLGWHLNNGPDNSPSFFPVSRFKEEFYRPDVIDAILETYDETQAIALANQRSPKKVIAEAGNIRQKLPPTVVISSPGPGSTVNKNDITISYSITSPDDAPAKNLRVLIDGRPVATQRGLNPVAAATQKITVTIPSQDCTITLLADNDNGTSPEANLLLKWSNVVAAREEFTYKPKLYVLAIGVSDYSNPELKLAFAAKDASDFVEAISRQKQGLYSDVVVRKLVNKEATKDAITDGLEWIQKQTGQKDVAMIFFAGHGVNDNNGVFYMLPVAADLERTRTTCLNFEELKQTVSSIAGKVVVFIDACHSGNVMGNRRSTTDINAVVNELSNTENGAITYTSSTGKEFSLEDPAWGNGAFTKAVIEGLNGKAAYGRNKITIKSLDTYISDRVKELTKGKQHPTSVSPPNVPDFPIAVSQ